MITQSMSIIGKQPIKSRTEEIKYQKKEACNENASLRKEYESRTSNKIRNTWPYGFRWKRGTTTNLSSCVASSDCSSLEHGNMKTVAQIHHHTDASKTHCFKETFPNFATKALQKSAKSVSANGSYARPKGRERKLPKVKTNDPHDPHSPLFEIRDKRSSP